MARRTTTSQPTSSTTVSSSMVATLLKATANTSAGRNPNQGGSKGGKEGQASPSSTMAMDGTSSALSATAMDLSIAPSTRRLMPSSSTTEATVVKEAAAGNMSLYTAVM